MNYDLEDEAEQLGIFGGWCSFYSYFDCAVHVQMTGINSENDPEAFARALAVLERNEAYRALCAEYVQLLQTQYMRSNNGQTRIKLMTFGIESESVKGARSRLTRIGLDMQGNFKKIGVESVLMDGKERLSLLHALFHMDDHAPFVFEWSWLPETGLSTKDFIAPGSFDFSPSRSFKIGETYCAASYIQIQTSSLSKKLLGELLRLPSSAVFSLHVQPMDQMTAIKLIKQKQVVLDATKISEQQKAFRSGYDIDIIPRDIDAYGDDTKRLLQTLGTNEKLYMATIVVMNMAGSKRQLDQAVAQTRGILQTRSCALIPLDFQQEKGLTACLPAGHQSAENRALYADECRCGLHSVLDAGTLQTGRQAGLLRSQPRFRLRHYGRSNREPKSERVDLRHIRQRQVRFRQAGDDLHLSDHG